MSKRSFHSPSQAYTRITVPEARNICMHACLTVDSSITTSGPSLSLLIQKSSAAAADCSSSSQSRPRCSMSNPATRRWFTLSRPNKASLLSMLAFDPCVSQHYKVISFVSWQIRGAELEVFSSETGEWSEHNVKWGVESNTMSVIMTYFNGVLYILSYAHYIICIHLETTKAQRVELPEPARAGAHIGRNGGSLCYYAGSDAQRVWVLESLNSCRWEVKGCISLKAVTGHGLSELSGVQVRFLAFHPELEVVYFFVSGKLISFDMRRKRVEEVGDFGRESERGYLLQIWMFQFSDNMSDCLLEQ